MGAGVVGCDPDVSVRRAKECDDFSKIGRNEPALFVGIVLVVTSACGFHQNVSKLVR